MTYLRLRRLPLANRGAPVIRIQASLALRVKMPSPSPTRAKKEAALKLMVGSGAHPGTQRATQTEIQITAHPMVARVMEAIQVR